MLNKKLLGSVSSPPAEYVDDVFSTFLFETTDVDVTINNGIDLAGKGGLVWNKSRSNAYTHELYDTVRGGANSLRSNATDPQQNAPSYQVNFANNGFTWKASGGWGSSSFCSWTFREAPKFFDVVTYTGTGSARTVAHNLDSVPGMIIVKRTDTTGAWQVYHRANTAAPETDYLVLNTTAATADNINRWNDTLPTTTVFSLGTDTTVNASGGTYVAYLFAHDAGGFGAAGTDNIISCGSFTTDSEGGVPQVNLGFEPQYILWKRSNSTSAWGILDIMRGLNLTSSAGELTANTTNIEGDGPRLFPNATGFSSGTETPFAGNSVIIYMAIRRPMKPPTSGTEVFSPIASSAALNTKLTTNFVVDSQWTGVRAGDSDNITVIDRLRKTSTNATQSNGNFLETSNTAAENTGAGDSRAAFWDNTGFRMPGSYENGATIFWNFRRATGFFDVVCYTGTGSTRTVDHNLGVAPEIAIVKRRSGTSNWVFSSATTIMYLNSTSPTWNAPGASIDLSLGYLDTFTSTTFTANGSTNANASGSTYVAYLFSTCAGVSKVGSYTGNGTTQTINCGFTSGARFVLIKRTDSAGSWFVWDTARGIVSGNDPYLLLNSNAAEVTITDFVDPVSTGFELSSTALATVNVSGGSYIFLAIA